MRKKNDKCFRIDKNSFDVLTMKCCCVISHRHRCDSVIDYRCLIFLSKYHLRFEQIGWVEIRRKSASISILQINYFGCFEEKRLSSDDEAFDSSQTHFVCPTSRRSRRLPDPGTARMARSVFEFDRWGWRPRRQFHKKWKIVVPGFHSWIGPRSGQFFAWKIFHRRRR